MSQTIERLENRIDRHTAYGHIPFTLGLPNYGQTCYINSIIQCVQNLKSIVIIVRSIPFSIEMLHNNRRFIPFFNNFLKLISASYRLDEQEAIQQPILAEFRESKLKHILEHVHTNGFRSMRQEDAHMFLMNLLRWLRDDITVCGIILPELHQSINFNEIRLTTAALMKVINGMQIKFKQTMICPRGHSSTYEYEDILSLQLRDASNSMQYFNDINESIRHYFTDTFFPHCDCLESTNSCNAFNCTVCNEHVPARRVINITQLPEVLIIKFDLGGLDENNLEVRTVLFALFVHSCTCKCSLNVWVSL